jgi:2-oxoglutarate ferredoxin oxidoreductase subunit alpha
VSIVLGGIMKKVLMKGNEALAESAIRAGCRFYSGYPITPQSEILEYMSWRMHEVGGEFIQTESEIAGINMVLGAAAAGARALTTTSGPGFSLMQEGISYLAADDIPAVIANVMRIGSGLGDISQGQGDYWQLTRGGGHGDYRTITLAPASVQECADLTYNAFTIAERYRQPVLIAPDAAIGQMVETVELPTFVDHDIDRYDWVLKSRKANEKQRYIVNMYYKLGVANYPEYLLHKYSQIMESEQRWEQVCTEDAEIILIAYGISSRVCKEAIRVSRDQGRIKLGLVRPITLWPFPHKAFDNLSDTVKGFLSVEMSILGQMVDDIILSTNNRFPVTYYGEFAEIPSYQEIIKRAEDFRHEIER